jgi:prepilin-type N-terminal cleavage/methylation domain-containing protein
MRRTPVRPYPTRAGFSLVEVLVATTMLAGVLTALAQLFVLGARVSTAARRTTAAVMAAQQKLEELRSLAWTFDASGAPVSAPALAPSPAGTLAANMPGYCEFLDNHGRLLGVGGSPPSGTTVVRRWSIGPLAGGTSDTIVLEVVAGDWDEQAVSGSQLRNEVRLVAVRTRQLM